MEVSRSVPPPPPPPPRLAPRPLTVHVVLLDGAVAAVHRTIRLASVHAWTLALSDPVLGAVAPKLRIETWSVSSGGDTLFEMASDVWELDVGTAAQAVKESPKKLEEWQRILSSEHRVPKNLWNDLMRPV